jgi:hypothetical protein
VGGGTGGVGAALQRARLGARTIVAEATPLRLPAARFPDRRGDAPEGARRVRARRRPPADGRPLTVGEAVAMVTGYRAALLKKDEARFTALEGKPPREAGGPPRRPARPLIGVTPDSRPDPTPCGSSERADGAHDSRQRLVVSRRLLGIPLDGHPSSIADGVPLPNVGSRRPTTATADPSGPGPSKSLGMTRGGRKTTGGEPGGPPPVSAAVARPEPAGPRAGA